MLSEAGTSVSIFLINRHLDEDMSLDLALEGFGTARLLEHTELSGHKLEDRNSIDAPNTVIPKKGRGIALEDGKLVGALKPLSYHLVRVSLDASA